LKRQIWKTCGSWPSFVTFHVVAAFTVDGTAGPTPSLSETVASAAGSGAVAPLA
jgi:hypothetical protein